MSFKVNIELSPDGVVILDSLCTFYEKTQAEVIEIAIETLASKVKLQTLTHTAHHRRARKNWEVK